MSWFNKMTPKRFIRAMSVIIGVVLIWRGIWQALDHIDNWLFGGHHFWTALIGILLGILVLYLPDKNLNEIEKL